MKKNIFSYVTFVMTFLIMLTITNLCYGQHYPYPIIFVHGLTGSDETFEDTMTEFSNILDWGPINVFDVILNADNNNKSAVLAEDVKWEDWQHDDNSINVGRRSFLKNPETNQFDDGWLNSDSRLFAINFKEERVRGASGLFSGSNQSAIYKQGFALSQMIREVLEFTNSEKVIMIGHSMGGLAIREYLQRIENNSKRWWVDPNTSSGHKVARVVTIGTPHLGSNSGFDPTKRSLVPDRNFEALRDLKYLYQAYPNPSCNNLDAVGIYLFGGNEACLTNPDNENNPFENVDINCNGIVNDDIIGLNCGTSFNPDLPLPTDILYTWIMSDCKRGESSASLITGIPNGIKGDGAVLLEKQWLHENNVPVPEGAAYTLLLNIKHTDEKSAYSAIIQGLDEPNFPQFAYKIETKKEYQSIPTVQPDESTTDDDWYKFHFDGGLISISLTPVTEIAGRIDLYTEQPVDSSTNYSSIFLDFDGTEQVSLSPTQTFDSGVYYLRIRHQNIQENTWKTPCIFKIIKKKESGPADSPWPMYGHDARNSRQSQYIGKAWGVKAWTNYDFDSPISIGKDNILYYVYKRSYQYSNCLNWPCPCYLHTCYDYKLRAFESNNDQIIWSNLFAKESYSSNSSVPAISRDGTIYIGGTSGFKAIDSNGRDKWDFDCYIRYTSPKIGLDGTVYFIDYHYNLYAVTSEGSLKWKIPEENFNPIIVPAIDTNGIIFTGNWDGYLFSIDSNGTIKWKINIGKSICSAPSIDSSGNIYICSLMDNNFIYLNSIASDGSLKWIYKTNETYYSKSFICITLNDKVYTAIEDDGLYALNKHGSLLWKFQIEKDLFAPAVGADGTVYINAEDDKLYAINDDGRLKWKTSAPDGPTVIGSDGTVYVGGEGSIRAYNLGNNGCLSGYVLDYFTKKPIVNAIISTIDNQSTQTDNNGYYYIVLSPGLYDITFSKTDFETQTIENVLITNEGDANTKLDTELTTPGPLNITTPDLTASELNIKYNTRIIINGGARPYTFTVAYGTLPTGLSLDKQYGNISGIPTIPGSFTFSIGVLDGKGAYSEEEFTINVTEQLRITSQTPLMRGTEGAKYFYSLEVSGGESPYEFSKISGSFPSGISLDNSGNLSGTPYRNGAYDFKIGVTDNAGRSTEKDFHLEIDDLLIISTNKLNNGVVGQPYNNQLSAAGGFGAYQWKVYSGSLPDGVSLNNNVLLGTPTETAYGTIVLSVQDESRRIAYKDLILHITNPIEILTTSLPNGLKGELYSEAVRVNGGIKPFSFNYEGYLPDGLSLDSTKGIISGTPQKAHLKNVNITVSDSSWPTSQSTMQNLSIRTTSLLTIITSAILPKGKKGVSINPIIFQAGGGPSPYRWEIIDGYLPSGIIIDTETGELSGTPLDKGDFNIVLQITDANGNTSQKEFLYHISDDLSIISTTIPDGAKDVSYNFTLEANGGFLPYNWRLKSGSFPDGISFNSSTGTLYGIPKNRQTRTFTIEVNDSDTPAQKTQHTFVLEILDELFIYTKDIPKAKKGQEFIANFLAKLGTPPYSWILASGVLPEGLQLNSSSNEAALQGKPSETGKFVFVIEVNDSSTPIKQASREFEMDVFGNVEIQTEFTKSAIRGEPYSETITAEGGQLPYHWQIIEGKLPVGLSFNSTSGHISGITTLLSGQSSSFKVRVTETGIPYDFDEKEFVVVVLDSIKILTQSVQKAMQKSSYYKSLEGEGGISPYHWSIIDGNLSDGLVLNAETGEISGKPLQCGTFDFSVKMEDSSNAANPVFKAYQHEVVCCSSCYDISGNILNVENVQITIEGSLQDVTYTDNRGTYIIQNLSNGNYTITPHKTRYTFEPVSKVVNIQNIDIFNIDFDAIRDGLKGDYNYDNIVNLSDSILVIKLIAGMTKSEILDINDDQVERENSLGLTDLIYILQQVTNAN